MQPAELTSERKKTHGSFWMNACISQSLKKYARSRNGYDKLNDVQKEALDMIFLKISRILSGQNEHSDHWDDIAGYAHLASTIKSFSDGNNA